MAWAFCPMVRDLPVATPRSEGAFPLGLLVQSTTGAPPGKRHETSGCGTLTRLFFSGQVCDAAVRVCVAL